MREHDSVLALQRNVEARTAQVAHVPAAAIITTEARVEDVSPVLAASRPNFLELNQWPTPDRR
ncbi:MAG TPA: hypothetical protein VES67_26375 [Vicinamibacterales bacterium]|nr:hypothetical protein [Vicinamibacterales bacterium]